MQFYFLSGEKTLGYVRATANVLKEVRALRAKHKEAFKYDDIIAEAASLGEEGIKSNKEAISSLVKMQTDAKRNNSFDEYLIDFAKICTDISSLNDEEKKEFKSDEFWAEQDILLLQGFIDSFRAKVRA
jgi:hypothetical protein